MSKPCTDPKIDNHTIPKQVMDEIQEEINKLSQDWQCLGKTLFKFILGIARDLSVAFTMALFAALTIIMVTMAGSMVQDPILKIIQPCYDYILMGADPGAQKSKVRTYILKSIEFTFEICDPVAETMKQTHVEQYKQYQKFKKNTLICAGSMAGFRSELNSQNVHLLCDDETSMRMGNLIREGAEDLILQMWNSDKNFSINNTSSKCRISDATVFIIATFTQLRNGLALATNFQSNGFSQRFTLFLSKLYQISTNDIATDRLDSQTLELIAAVAKKTAKTVAPSMITHFFGQRKVYNVAGTAKDLKAPEHERCRTGFLYYIDYGSDKLEMNENENEVPILLKKSKGFARFVQDIQWITDIGDDEIDDVVNELPQNGVTFDGYCNILYDLLEEYNPAQIVRDIEIMHEITTVFYQNDERVPHFDDTSPLWVDEMKDILNQDTPHSTYCEGFNWSQELQHNISTPAFTKKMCNKLDYKIFRMIPMISVLNQVIKSHDENGDGHRIDSFEDPTTKDCMAANGIYKNIVEGYGIVDKKFGAFYSYGVGRRRNRNIKCMSRTPPPARPVATKFDKMLNKIKKQRVNNEFKVRDSYYNVTMNGKQIAAADGKNLIQDLVQLKLVISASKQNHYKVVSPVNPNNDAAIGYFNEKSRDFVTNWICFMELETLNDDAQNEVENNDDAQNERAGGEEEHKDDGADAEVNRQEILEHRDNIMVVLGDEYKHLALNPIIAINATSAEQKDCESNLVPKLKVKLIGDWHGPMHEISGNKHGTAEGDRWKGYSLGVLEKFRAVFRSGVKFWDSRKPKSGIGHPFVGPGQKITFVLGVEKLQKKMKHVFLVLNPKENISDFCKVKAYAKDPDLSVAIMYIFE
eukprot:121747_1